MPQLTIKGITIDVPAGSKIELSDNGETIKVVPPEPKEKIRVVEKVVVKEKIVYVDKPYPVYQPYPLPWKPYVQPWTPNPGITWMSTGSTTVPNKTTIR